MLFRAKYRNAQQLMTDRYPHERGFDCQRVAMTIGIMEKVHAERIAVRVLPTEKNMRQKNMSPAKNELTNRISKTLSVVLWLTKKCMMR